MSRQERARHMGAGSQAWRWPALIALTTFIAMVMMELAAALRTPPGLS